MSKGKTEISYGEENFALDEVKFLEWQEKINQIDAIVGVGDDEKELAKDWISYNAIINEGFFVSKPHLPEPDISKVFEEETSDDGIFDAPPHEPVWTQSRILAERDKLLKEREKFLERKEKAFERKVDSFQNKLHKTEGALFHEDGSPYTIAEILGVIGFVGLILYLMSVPLLVIICIGLLCFWAIRKAK